ncbi:MAG: N-acetylmuramoyl-L-alanine amidase family protein [Waltera sp.]
MKVWKKQKGLLVRTMICAVSLAAACFYGNSLPAQAAPRAQETGERVVIVIDPGHGGDNEGTLEGPAQEKKMTMVTALAMYEELTKYDNVDVYLTHTDDVTMSLADRAQFAADRNADFLFSIHYNASMDHDLFGSEVWISSVQPYNAYGYQFGWEQMQQMQDMGLFLRGVKTKLKDNGDDYYGIIRESTSDPFPPPSSSIVMWMRAETLLTARQKRTGRNSAGRMLCLLQNISDYPVQVLVWTTVERQTLFRKSRCNPFCLPLCGTRPNRISAS